MSRLFPLAPLFLLACAPAVGGPDLHSDGDALRVVEDGTPESWGVLAFLNDPSTTQDVLDHDVPLDARAAASLIEHRNGPDGHHGSPDDAPFTSIDQVDDCYYVGEVALERLLAYADTWGYVPGPTDHVGTWDDVDFTYEQAVWTLELVNTASHAYLDAYIDVRAADAIVDRRPVLSMDELSVTWWVGPVAMATLKDLAIADYGDPGAQLYETCYDAGDCAEGLVCMGHTLWDQGWCESDELAGTFVGSAAGAIPDDSATGVTDAVEVSGLASVPVDIIVTLDIDHADRSQLVVTLTDPNGAQSVLWDRDPAATDEVYAISGITRDDMVNGTWTLHVADLAAGTTGTVEGWELYIISNWD